jgi:pSer/pThr/pTyr-binding forkhead associated (FHA) protein
VFVCDLYFFFSAKAHLYALILFTLLFSHSTYSRDTRNLRTPPETFLTMLPAGIASPTAAPRPTGRLRGLFHSHSSSSSSRPTNTRQRRATSPLNNATDNTWIPTVSGVSGLSRVATLPAESQQSQQSQRSSFNPSNGTNPGNTGSGSISSSSNSNSGNQGQGNTGGTGTSNSTNSAAAAAPSTSIMPSATGGGVPHAGADANTTLSPLSPAPVMPSIRFSPHLDPRSNRQSLHFTPIERLLRSPNDRIRVGRASERDSSNPLSPVGFSSKVVSRRHCEFWHENNQWFVKDVKSSSGTFLNHVRLSAPGVESKAYPINDGDILQLGIDFKGGEEQIFRCVKIRVELNKAPWGKGVNQFKYVLTIYAPQFWLGFLGRMQGELWDSCGLREAGLEPSKGSGRREAGDVGSRGGMQGGEQLEQQLTDVQYVRTQTVKKPRETQQRQRLGCLVDS